MPGDILIRPQAKQDIIDQALYIVEQDPDVADRFLDAVKRALNTLVDTPQIGALREFDNPTLAEIRMWPIRGFEKHLIFYRPLKNGIDVIRILHAARDIPRIMEEKN